MRLNYYNLFCSRHCRMYYMDFKN